MPIAASDDLALRVAYVVGEAISQQLADVSMSTALLAAVAAAHDAAGFSDKVYAHARTIAAKFSHFPVARAGGFARDAILSARDLADLPDELAARFWVISSILGFEAPDALAAVDWLENTGKAVVGVEIFYPDKDPMYVQAIGTSGYASSATPSEWRAKVAEYAREAKNYIEARRADVIPEFMRLPGAAPIFSSYSG